jgi:gluconate 2-dehydrogenase gamma chain
VAWYHNLSRREFLKTAAAAAMMSGASGCVGARSPWRFLTIDEARTLAAICDRIIPPDSDPGADWARVVNFIDVQLCGPYGELRSSYRAGLACLERTSRKQRGRAFAEMTSDQQTLLLAALEKGDVPVGIWDGVNPKTFFEMVLSHTMQGFYGDPRHGGNRDRVSWKMLGLPYPQVRGRRRVPANS